MPGVWASATAEMTFGFPSVRILFWVRCASLPYCPVKQEGQATKREHMPAFPSAAAPDMCYFLLAQPTCSAEHHSLLWKPAYSPSMQNVSICRVRLVRLDKSSSEKKPITSLSLKLLTQNSILNLFQNQPFVYILKCLHMNNRFGVGQSADFGLWSILSARRRDHGISCPLTSVTKLHIISLTSRTVLSEQSNRVS